jgi:hypothetical protein
MSESMDWKALFNPKLVFRYPVRTLATLCAAVGVINSPLDFNNRYLSFGFFLLCLSFATNISRDVYRPSRVSQLGQKTPYVFSPAALFQCLALWPFTVALAILCLHQLGVTPRLDAYLKAWARSHPLL